MVGLIGTWAVKMLVRGQSLRDSTAPWYDTVGVRSLLSLLSLIQTILPEAEFYAFSKAKSSGCRRNRP